MRGETRYMGQREDLKLHIDDEDNENEESGPHDVISISETQLILLCLDHLRSLLRCYPSKKTMSSVDLSSDFISLAIFALDRSFLPTSKLAKRNDPYMPSADSNQIDVTFRENQTTLPSLKSIENTILNDKNEYNFIDSHRSNQDRFFHLNGLASGNSQQNSSVTGGPITLTDITLAGLDGLGARSRVDAENSMVQGPLFGQFFAAVKEKGFFKDGEGKQMQPDSDAYAERYRKVVSKFRSKLATKAEKALAETPTNGQHHITSPNNMSLPSSASWGHGFSNNPRQFQLSAPPPLDKIESSPHQYSNLGLDEQTNERDLQEAEALKNKGNQHMQAKAYKKAVESYTSALAVLPSGPTSHVYFCNRAAAFLSLKQYYEAINDSERSLALKPDYGKAHARLGLAYFLTENFEASIDSYTLALRYEPENKSSRGYLEKAKKKLAEQQAKQKKDDSSKPSTTSDKARYHPEHDENRQRLIDQREADKFKMDGNNFMSQKQYQEAVDCYTEAITLCPSGLSSHVYYSNRAAALCYLERYDEAERDSEMSLKLKPDYGKAYARLGLSRFFLEDYKGAAEAYTSALEFDPNNAACMSYLAKAQKMLASNN